MRLFQIFYIVLLLGLDEFLLARYPICCRFLSFFLFWRDLSDPLAVRFRLALERLGPIFVKFGQLLSTRRDFLSEEMAEELAKLQDQVPPFSSEAAVDIIENSLKQPINQLFRRFDHKPVASASVAQVHYAELHDGRRVAVKVLRPQILPVIESDLALLHNLASLVRRWLPDGQRLRPEEIVTEFDHHLHDELNLLYEAGNASELRRHFLDSSMLVVPEVLYDYTTEKVLTLEWMEGIPISQVEAIHAAGIDLKTLSRLGVEIFFTQVFRDGFFHADMHPGNILVAFDHRYIALDFGIVGMLSEFDKRYLAMNFLAFFNRDYLRVAHAHIESGWVPAGTSAPAFAAAIRTVCEPFFNKPLSEISLSRVLIRLFEVSRRFNMSVQPQLILLQKTLLNIEGLGRQLDPALNLWETAKPFLERWMKEQLGWKSILRNLKYELPQWAQVLPTFPRRISQVLDCNFVLVLEENHRTLLLAQKKWNKLLGLIALLLASLLALLLGQIYGLMA